MAQKFLLEPHPSQKFRITVFVLRILFINRQKDSFRFLFTVRPVVINDVYTVFSSIMGFVYFSIMFCFLTVYTRFWYFCFNFSLLYLYRTVVLIYKL